MSMQAREGKTRVKRVESFALSRLYALQKNGGDEREPGESRLFNMGGPQFSPPENVGKKETIHYLKSILESIRKLGLR